MHLIRGFCLLKIGRARNDVVLVDESLAVFEAIGEHWMPAWLTDVLGSTPPKRFRVQQQDILHLLNPIHQMSQNQNK